MLNCPETLHGRQRRENLAAALAAIGEPKPGEYFDLLIHGDGLVVWSGAPWQTILRLADMAARVGFSVDQNHIALRVRKFQTVSSLRGTGKLTAEIDYTFGYSAAVQNVMRRRVKIVKTGFTSVTEHRI